MRPLPRLILILSVFGLSLSLQPLAHAADDANAYIQSLGNQALAVISNKALDKGQKQVRLEKLFSENVDFPWVGRFVMGRFWRQASDDQKTRYLKAYEKFLILHYTSRFTDYTSGSFKVDGVKEDGDGEYTVNTEMQANEPNSEPVLVDYRVRKQDKGYIIFDVIVEGVSLITTQRSEFASVLNNKGVDYLIDQLVAKSATGDLTLANSHK